MPEDRCGGQDGRQSPHWNLLHPFRFTFYSRPSGSLLTQSIRTSDSLLPATKGHASFHRTRVPALPSPAPRTCTRAGLRPRRLRPRAFHLVHSSLEEVLLPPPLGSPPTTQLSPTLPCIVRPHPSRSTAALLEFNRGPHLREHFAGNIQFCAGRIPATLLARDSSDISRAT